MEANVIRLSDERSKAVADALPFDTLALLRDPGVPELVVFGGIDHVFTLDMEPLLDGGAFRLGTVDRDWYAIAVQRATGYFGYVSPEDERPPWAFCNSSVACFLSCIAASERLWQMEDAKLIAWESRGEWLEREIRQIDPVVFNDENNIWSFLVEELQYGVV